MRATDFYRVVVPMFSAAFGLGWAATARAVTISGNGGTGFGGPVGQGTLSVTDDGVGNVTFAFTPGAIHPSLDGNNLVLYLSTGTPGLTDTSTLTDDGNPPGSDFGRIAISGYNDFSQSPPTRSVIAFPSGFQATYAISMANAYDGLFQLPPMTGTGGLSYITGASPVDNVQTLTVPLSDLGLTQGQSFELIGTLIDGSAAYRSDEAFGKATNSTIPGVDLSADGNPGFNNLITFSTFDTVTTSAASGISIVSNSGLTINAGQTVSISPAASHANQELLVVTAPGLSIAGAVGAWTGLLDLTNNDMDLPGGSLATVTDQVRQGYANGNWNRGGGITSSSAASDSTHLTALGVIQNSVDQTPTGAALMSSFDGQSVSSTDVLIKYTYYGDANLDGQVDASDYSLIDNGYLNHLTGWYNGDFNYDGVVNGSDYTLIDNTYNSQGASLASAIAAPTAQFAGEGTSAVPEPAAFSLLLVCGGGLLGRRRLVGHRIV